MKKEKLCKVCQVEVTRRKEYTSNVCEACQKFFQRACQRQQRLECRYMGNCFVFHASRRACARCRFDRCVKAGMFSKFLRTRLNTISSSNSTDISEVAHGTNQCQLQNETLVVDQHQVVGQQEVMWGQIYQQFALVSLALATMPKPVEQCK